MNIEKAAIQAIDATVAGYEIYLATAKAMDVIQVKEITGREKLDWVIAFIKGTIVEVAENWQFWSEKLIRFISSIKTIYNIVRAK